MLSGPTRYQFKTSVSPLKSGFYIFNESKQFTVVHIKEPFDTWISGLICHQLDNWVKLLKDSNNWRDCDRKGFVNINKKIRKSLYPSRFWHIQSNLHTYQPSISSNFSLPFLMVLHIDIALCPFMNFTSYFLVSYRIKKRPPVLLFWEVLRGPSVLKQDLNFFKYYIRADIEILNSQCMIELKFYNFDFKHW